MAAEKGVNLGSGMTRGRHRGEPHDPIGSALTATWVLGYVLALFLRGVTVTQHSELEELSRPWPIGRYRTRKRPAEGTCADHQAIRPTLLPGRTTRTGRLHHRGGDATPPRPTDFGRR